MGFEFFDRAIRLVVESEKAPGVWAGAFDISSFDCEFKAKKTINPMQPNSLQLKVFN
jgi:hypothetical protein